MADNVYVGSPLPWPGSSARDRLAIALLDRSMWVHDRLALAGQHGLSLQEETLTQDLLLDLAVMVPELNVRTFTRSEENRNGADWQWDFWFHGHGWFGIRIQAKRLRKYGRRLTYGIDYATSTGLQIDSLIAEARSDGLHAGYVFYNGPELDLSLFTWACQVLPPDQRLFGTSFMPATMAKRLLSQGHKDLATVGSRSLPLPCLIRCGPQDGCRQLLPYNPPPDGPLSIDRLAAWNFLTHELWGRIMNYGRNFWRQVDESIREYPPDYVTRLFQAEPPDPEGHLPNNVDAVVIVSATSERYG